LHGANRSAVRLADSGAGVTSDALSPTEEAWLLSEENRDRVTLRGSSATAAEDDAVSAMRKRLDDIERINFAANKIMQDYPGTSPELAREVAANALGLRENLGYANGMAFQADIMRNKAANPLLARDDSMMAQERLHVIEQRVANGESRAGHYVDLAQDLHRYDGPAQRLLLSEMNRYADELSGQTVFSLRSGHGVSREEAIEARRADVAVRYAMDQAKASGAIPLNAGAGAQLRQGADLGMAGIFGATYRNIRWADDATTTVRPNTLVEHVEHPNPLTGEGYGVNNPPVRIQGTWSDQDIKDGLRGRPPRGLGSPDLHHADQMPGSGIHEVLPAQHRGNPALHPNDRRGQGVTPDMRRQDRELHWWYRAREQGADQRFPHLIYDK
jgi:hypothetical protein